MPPPTSQTTQLTDDSCASSAVSLAHGGVTVQLRTMRFMNCWRKIKQEIQGMPCNATVHLADHPADIRYARVFGSVSRTWWRNSPASPCAFKELLEEDATQEFQGMPCNATTHFVDHPTDRRLVRVFGSGSRTWWRNSPATTNVLLELPEEDATE